MPNHNVLAVANRFLDLGQASATRLTPMHLQKLCYLAEGFELAFYGEDLIRDEVQAWTYGPVYPPLYNALRRFGSGAVTEPIRRDNWSANPEYRGEIVREEMTPTEDLVIQWVFNSYAHLPAFQLSAMTHADNSPWSQSYVPGQNAPISAQQMGEYFRAVPT